MNEKTDQTIIRARGLSRSYTVGDTTVVGIRNIDLDISTGELVVLKGESGSGKSTLLSLLAGLDTPSGGDLLVANHDLAHSTDDQLTTFRRQIVGMVFQSFNLMPTLTVLENALLPALLAGKPLDQCQPKATEHLNWLGMGKRFDHLPGQLSGGEMQRTAIARALINEPALILADEPTGNLDSANGRAVIELLVDLNHSFGRTVVIATHSHLADSAASLSIRLQDGQIAG